VVTGSEDDSQRPHAGAAVRSFVSPQTSLAGLDATSVASLIASASDVTLVLDAAGVIRDLAFQSEELLGDLNDSASWIGRPVAATVMPDSRGKVEALLRGATEDSDSRWRHINHRGPDGASVPVLYCCVRLPGGDRMVMFGRDLRVMSALQQRLVAAQQSLERDYSRLRETEVRYRLLFQQSSEAILILDAEGQRVTEANPAARRLLTGEDRELVDRDLASLLAADSAPLVQAYLGRIAAGGRSEEVAARVAHGSAAVQVRAALFRQEGRTFLLVRLAPQGAAAAPSSLPDVKSTLLRAVESAPDGFVVTDADGDVLDANAAFLDMAGLGSADQARGRSIENWLGEGVDMNVLFANLRSRGSVRFFSTAMHGDGGRAHRVEVSAVSVRNENEQPLFGFAVRDVGARLKLPLPQERQLPRSVEQLTELIGRVPLKDLVRDATEVIERLCIEAALELTGDNRASAAEMLGLSRQSLYVKLRRYGLGDLSPGDAE
jgi:transcriptional regulator PpsR